MSETSTLVQIVEAALLAAGKPLSIAQIEALFEEHEKPAKEDLRAALAEVGERCEGRGYELIEVASGFRFQVREQLSPWISRLWQERPQRYSRALLETLALIAYRQPITRGEIEEIRGVAVSSNIIKTLHERDWIRVVGHRDVPGRPAMYATTRQFLDYFNLKSLEQLPALADIRDVETLTAELGFTDAVEDKAEAAPQDQATDAGGSALGEGDDGAGGEAGAETQAATDSAGASAGAEVDGAGEDAPAAGDPQEAGEAYPRDEEGSVSASPDADVTDSATQEEPAADDADDAVAAMDSPLPEEEQARGQG